jgi:hypothetical protein
MIGLSFVAGSPDERHKNKEPQQGGKSRTRMQLRESLTD